MSTLNTTKYPAHVAKTAAQLGASATKVINMLSLGAYDAKIKDWIEDQILAIPEEKYLDGVKTVVIDKFDFATWEAALDATETAPADPNLDGETVLVIAIKNVDINNSTGAEEITTEYNIVSLKKLIDVYEAVEFTGVKADGDAAIELKVEDGTGTNAGKKMISAELKLYAPTGSSEKDNAIVIKDDGTAYAADLTEDVNDINDEIGEWTNYEATNDSTVDSNKTYYELNGSQYEEVANPVDADIANYFEKFGGTGLKGKIEDLEAGAVNAADPNTDIAKLFA